MMVNKKNYIEKISIACLICCLLLLSYKVFKRIKHKKNENDIAIYSKKVNEYEEILNKYNFNIIKFNETEDSTYAIVEKDEIIKTEFEENENFEIIENDEFYQIYFIKNKNKPSNIQTKQTQKYNLNGIVFIKEDKWIVTLNNTCYTPNSNKIAENIYIKTVNKDSIIIIDNYEEIVVSYK